MRVFHAFLSWLLAIQLSLPSLAFAQGVLQQPGNPFVSAGGTTITNLRLAGLTPDGSEATLQMNYTYDGFGGQVAQIVAVLDKKDQKGVSAWFGCDPVSVGQGRGLVSLKVRYFNDEIGVPPELTTDRIRILILNQAGNAMLSSIPFLKTVKWGNPNVKATLASQIPILQADPAEQARAALQAKAAVEAELKAREVARLAAESEAKARAEAEAREAARLAAEEQAKKLAEEKQRAQAQIEKLEQERKAQEALAKAQEEARLKAEQEARRVAEETRAAEARALAEAKTREEARIKAENEARRIAEEKRLAEARALAEAKAREEARLKAEAEEKARLEAEARTLAQAKAREEAR